MLRPNFGLKFDTPDQLLENNMILLMFPGGQFRQEFFLSSPIETYNKLGETMLVTDTWDEFDYYSQHHILEKNTHVQIASYLYPYEQAWGRWYRSKEITKGSNSYTGYISNKKWNLTEVNMKSSFAAKND